MKKIIYVFYSILLGSATLHADFDDRSISAEKIDSTEDLRPFSLEAYGTSVGRAKIDKHDFSGHVTYNELEADITAGFYYNPCYKEGLALSLGYNDTRIDWNRNPFFHQTHFHTAIVSLEGMTERLRGWTWRGLVALNMNTDHFSDFWTYATYDFLLWGRYAYSCDIGIHTGVLAYTGMKVDHVYPILGVDWRANKNWLLSLVYPVNISAAYFFDEHWSLAVAARFFNNRNRAGRHEPVPEAIVTYRNTGAELALNYDSCWLTTSVYGGMTLAGKMTIANDHYREKHHFRLDGAPYFGGEIKLKF